MAVFDEAGRILLIREGYGARRWGLPGGAQEPGEDLRETAIREAKEETGLDVELGDLVGEYRINYADGGEELWVSVYSAHISGGVLEPRKGEIEAIAWVLPSELPTPLTNVVPVAIPDAVGELRDVTRTIHARGRRSS